MAHSQFKEPFLPEQTSSILESLRGGESSRLFMCSETLDGWDTGGDYPGSSHTRLRARAMRHGKPRAQEDPPNVSSPAGTGRPEMVFGAI